MYRLRDMWSEVFSPKGPDGIALKAMDAWDLRNSFGQKKSEYNRNKEVIESLPHLLFNAIQLYHILPMYYLSDFLSCFYFPLPPPFSFSFFLSSVYGFLLSKPSFDTSHKSSIWQTVDRSSILSHFILPHPILPYLSYLSHSSLCSFFVPPSLLRSTSSIFYFLTHYYVVCYSKYHVCYKELAVGIYGPAAPITVASWDTPCSRTALVRAYSDHVIRGLNMQGDTHYAAATPSRTIVITFMARRRKKKTLFFPPLVMWCHIISCHILPKLSLP